MSKKAFLWLCLEWAIYFAAIYWLVGGSIWLDLFLTSALSHAAFLSRRLDEQKLLFDIADAELVRVSSLAQRLEDEAAQVQEKFEHFESRIAELESA